MTFTDASLEDPGLSNRPGTWDMLRRLTGLAEPEAHLQGYRLHLGDDSHWWLGGFSSQNALIEKLATIMELQPGKPNDSNLMILIRNHTRVRRAGFTPEEASGWVHVNRNDCFAWYRPDFPDVLWELSPTAFGRLDYIFNVFASAFIYRESIRRGGLPFHAALVEREGQGVILAAPGETGKSTCCLRIPPPWLARCDDEVLMVLSPDGRNLAHPFPNWSDYLFERGEGTWKVQDPVTLAGVFFLEQSLVDDYVPLRSAEAAVAVTNSAQQVFDRLLRICSDEEARTLRRTIFSNACELVKKVPAFRLQVSLTGRFWDKIEAALGWR
jgi:SynChlorMet cassette protein ScmC